MLLALGTWQLERRAWKHGLIATINQRLAAPPAPLPAPRHLGIGSIPPIWSFAGSRSGRSIRHKQEALVFTSGSALRSDVSGPGYWVFTPARLPGGGVVVVNRGFVPEGSQDAKTRLDGQVPGVVDIVGVIRRPEARGLFTPADNPGRNLWFVRDHLAMAAAKNWGPVAPFFVDQEAPPATGRPAARRQDRTRSCPTTTSSTRSPGTGWRRCSSRSSPLWVRSRLRSPGRAQFEAGNLAGILKIGRDDSRVNRARHCTRFCVPGREFRD